MSSVPDFESRLRHEARQTLSPHLQSLKEELQSLESRVSASLKQVEEKVVILDGVDFSPAVETMKEALGVVVAKCAEDTENLSQFARNMRTRETQEEILTLLLDSSLRYAPRVTLFVLRGEQLAAWAARGYSDDATAAIASQTFPVSDSHVLSRAIEGDSVVSATDLSAESRLVPLLHEEQEGPWHAFPLRALQRPVAVLLATASEGRKCELEQLSAMMEVTGLCIENVALKILQQLKAAGPAAARREAPAPARMAAAAPVQLQPVPPPPAPAPAPVAEVKVPEPEPVPVAVEESAPVAVAELPPEPPQPAVETVAEPEAETVSVEPEPEPAVIAEAESHAAPPVEPPSVVEEEPVPVAAELVEEPHVPVPVMEEPLVETIRVPEIVAVTPFQIPVSHAVPVAEVQVAMEAHTPAVAAPVLVIAPPEPVPLKPAVPREVQRPSEEEKLHSDAKRFARLLVSEIKLYNEQRVVEGRANRDIYVRLKRDIDRSRDMYEKRVSPVVSKKIDYFHDEIVRILGENDASALGSDYPGSRVES
jgi:hypothetical protein